MCQSVGARDGRVGMGESFVLVEMGESSFLFVGSVEAVCGVKGTLFVLLQQC